MEIKFGWKPDIPDFRDKIYKYEPAQGVNLSNVDLRQFGKFSEVYDQGRSSSCTAQAISASVEYLRNFQSRKAWTPSRLFIYYNERDVEGTIKDADAGAMIRDGIKSVASIGVPDEKYWSFTDNPYVVIQKPPQAAYDNAHEGLIKQYSRVPQARKNILSCLSHRIPVVFGAALYESMMSPEVARTGVVPMPRTEEKMLGGHAMLIVGSTETHYIVRNSWGKGWGDEGHAYFPHEYLENDYLADDFWAMFLAV